jgi:dipeptidyl aminopeptidase/acylaminoacyl peptidase
VLVYDKPDTYEADEIYTDILDIGKAMWGPDLFDVRMPLASFKSAIDLLAKQGVVDPARVAVTGLSAGVGHVNYSLIHSDLFAAAITSSCEWAPSTYFLAGVSGDLIREYRRVIGAGRYGSPEGFLWEHISLALNTDRVRAPLLVNSGDHEHARALEEVTALIEDGKPVEMVVYPDEGHIKWQPAHRLAIYERNVDWLNFWLQGIEDSSPSKSGQNARWRRLRAKYLEREPVSAAVERAN